jgi:hypothetical protein
VAMHLIQKKLAGGDIPASLPPTLIPPSMRSTANGTSPFSPASPQFQQEVTHDLFSFDDTPPASATIHPKAGAVQPPSVLRSAPRDPFTSSSFTNCTSHYPPLYVDLIISIHSSTRGFTW